MLIPARARSKLVPDPSFDPVQGDAVPVTQTGSEEQTAHLLSVVIPVYNEAGSLYLLYRRLIAVLGQAGFGRSEMIMVDDGSHDSSYDTIRDLALGDDRVRGIRFARNFGKEAAIAAGLQAACGDVVILMDADLQHPPELIPDLVASWRSGYRMVTAVRRSRDTDPVLRRLVSHLFYRIFRWTANVDIPEGAGDFRLFDRSVVQAINSLPERNRFMKGITGWVGFSQGFVPFDPERRVGGCSTFSFFRLLRYGIDGLTAFSVVPLRIWSLLGLCLAAGSMLYGFWLVARTLVQGVDVPGYASLMVAVLFLSGVQLTGLGVLGEYIGRIFREVKGRPLFLIAEQTDTLPETSRLSGRESQ